MPQPALRVWVDAQLPPAVARWLSVQPDVEAAHVTDLGLLTATDPEIFDHARAAGVIVMTKDVDFVQLQERRGAPPQLVWVTVGNLTKARLLAIVAEHWPLAAALLRAGERLVEIASGKSASSLAEIESPGR